MEIANESNIISELDLRLVNALQLRPRAEWTELATAFGVTPATVARRWQALNERGLAWVAVTLGQPHIQASGSAFALVSCTADAVPNLAQRMVQEPAIATIATTMGRSRFLLDIFQPDLDGLRSYIGNRLDTLPGVTEVTSLLVITLYTGGQGWRIRALDAAEARHLSTRPHGSAQGRRRGCTADLDRVLIGELATDGRLSWAQLAARCGISAPTARRRVERLLAAGTIALRCDVATPAVGSSLHVTFLMQLPAAQLDTAGAIIASMPRCRLAAAVAGPHNLLATMWFSAVSEIVQFEKTVTQRLPDLVVDDRIVHLGAAKKLGHVLDTEGRTTGLVPLTAW
ncbi:Lrp/AsnC family transcriptional regulator [Streptomyces sp. NPDC057681]|uniref:Lrp/AsnC family transcriptional regulator n=1 Tax=Streptomyces sp. NPDC057681 TaxID=3346209 RepID=UPI003683DD07